MHYLLFYEVGEDNVSRRAEFRDADLEKAFFRDSPMAVNRAEQWPTMRARVRQPFLEGAPDKWRGASRTESPPSPPFPKVEKLACGRTTARQQWPLEFEGDQIQQLPGARPVCLPVDLAGNPACCP